MHRSDPRRVLILHNRRSGANDASDRVRSLADQLRGRDRSVEILTDLDAYRDAIHRAVNAGHDVSGVAAGGDGTASAVVSRTPPSVPLWILPLGTENLLARSLGMTADPAQATAAIASGLVRSIDAGLANDRVFLMMVGIGFDAAVVQRFAGARRGHIQKWHYALPIAKTIATYRFPQLEIDAGEQRWSAAWCFVMNFPKYAGGLSIPDPSTPVHPDDGRLDLCSFARGGVWHGVRYWWAVRSKRQSDLADYRRASLTEVTIRSRAQVPFQVDGDWGGYLPVSIATLPSRVRVFVPPASTKNT